MWSRLRIILSVSTSLAMVSCLPTGQIDNSNPNAGNSPGSGDSSSHSSSNASEGVQIQGLTLSSDGSITVSGKSLDKISSLKVIFGARSVPLTIVRSDKNEMTVTPSSTLSFIAGSLYDLIVSEAHADDKVVPITIQIPNGCVANGGTPVAVTFQGYTNATNGSFGGLKGGNDMCNAAFPGSHWASLDEIMKLGSAYPWSSAVWIRGESPQGYNDNSGQNATAYTDCASWTSSRGGAECPTIPSGAVGGSLLRTDGQLQQDCCSNLNKLACVQ